jgi:hypothetical protein
VDRVLKLHQGLEYFGEVPLCIYGVIDVFNQYFTYCATGIVVFAQQYLLPRANRASETG